MKKIMKKMVVMVLSFVLATAVLSACSNGNEGNTKPTEEVTQKPTTEVATTTPTEEVTQEPTQTPTESVEPTQVPTGENLVPLYYTGRESDFRQMTPDALYTFTNFAYYYFPLSENGRTFTTDESILYNLSYGSVFTIGADPVFGEGYDDCDIEICFFEHFEAGYDSNVVSMYYNVNGTESSIDFIPYYYNPTKHCLVGYYKKLVDGEPQFVLSEVYYAPDTNRLSPCTVQDTSEYDSYF